jgi:phage terminase small subunit
MTDRILAPRDLDPKHQGIFRDTLAILRDRKAPAFQRVTDVPLLEQMCREYQMAADARKRILDREEVEQGAGWWTRGPQKNLVPHPDYKIMRESLKTAGEDARELLLPPKTRKQFEIESGAGDADDPFA